MRVARRGSIIADVITLRKITLMARRKRGFKINTGKWGKPTSVRIGARGKGNVNISKKGVKVNPGCGCVVILAAFVTFSLASAGLLLAIPS